MSNLPDNIDFIAVEMCNLSDQTFYLCINDVVDEKKGLLSFVVAKDYSELNREFFTRNLERNNIDYAAVFNEYMQDTGQADPDSIWIVADGSIRKSIYFDRTSTYSDRWNKVISLVNKYKKKKVKEVKKRVSTFDRKLEKAFPYTGNAVLISSGDALDKLIKEAYTLRLNGPEELEDETDTN